MMKKTKTGFSLAELLIGLVIAAIIATMGMSIAKKGIENSYDAYIYTGYKGITDAITEANANGNTLNYSNVGNCAFTNDILNMFNVKNDRITKRTNKVIEFTTPNNITYNISTSGTMPSTNKHYYIIKIWFPTPNLQVTQDGKDYRRTADFLYAPDDDIGILLPIAENADPNKSPNYLLNLANRGDLLKFYIDDGKVGRTGPNGRYTKREYSNLNTILCSAGKEYAVGNYMAIKIKENIIPNPNTIWDIGDVVDWSLDPSAVVRPNLTDNIPLQNAAAYGLALPDTSNLTINGTTYQVVDWNSTAIKLTDNNFTPIALEFWNRKMLVDTKSNPNLDGGRTYKINDCQGHYGNQEGAIRPANPRKG